jgi:ATP-dependent Clp protease ATP-binding subunit ClpC
VYNVLLQVLDDGRLTDAAGRTVDFKNTVIIMTSNVGTRALPDATRIGFGPETPPTGSGYDRMKEHMLAGLRRIFPPELLNRIDEVIVFHPLATEQIERIVDLMIDRVREELRERNIALELTPAARKLLAEEGFDEQFGARPLRRAIQRRVENPISKGILDGTFHDGDTIEVDAEEGAIVCRLLVPAQGPAPAPVEELSGAAQTSAKG